MHEVLVNRLGGLSLPRKSVVRLTDRPDMTLDVYRGRKTTMQQQCNIALLVTVTVLAGDQWWPATSGGRLRLAQAVKHVLHHKFGHSVKGNKNYTLKNINIDEIFFLGGKR